MFFPSYVSLTLGLLISLSVTFWGYSENWGQPAYIAAGICSLTIIWWVFESIPLAATALLPLALFPLFGILEYDEIAKSYGHPVIMLLLGGFLLSKAMEVNNAHLRVAMLMLRAFGTGSSKTIVFGFMAASALLSMWISNSATALMLMPVALAVLSQSKHQDKLAIPLLLGICYACNIGGMGTPIGTPPNALFLSIYQEHTGKTIDFLDWMIMALPAVFILIPISAWWLTRNLNSQEQITLDKLGSWQSAEKRVLCIFGITALLWISRKQPFGGWSDLLNLPNIHDSTIALLASVALFIIPNGKGGKLLTWKAANETPWGILVLAAAGISISIAFSKTGLGTMLANNFLNMDTLPLFVIVLITGLIMTFLTEFLSNTAATAILLPVLIALATSANLDPAVLMFAATISASCAFMMPIASTPNILVFSTQKIPFPTMVANGLLINLIGVVVVAALAVLWIA